jgi:hypothetical protein
VNDIVIRWVHENPVMFFAGAWGLAGLAVFVAFFATVEYTGSAVAVFGVGPKAGDAAALIMVMILLFWPAVIVGVLMFLCVRPAFNPGPPRPPAPPPAPPTPAPPKGE